MRHSLNQSIGITLLFLLLTACSTPVTAPTAIPTTATFVPPTPMPESSTAIPTPQSADKCTWEKGQITSQALANNLIGDPAIRDFLVYLPPGYNTSDKRYPVVYALHGYTGTEKELIQMAFRLDKLVASGEAQEMIFIFVNGYNAFRGSWYLNSPTIGDYESYITRELVAHIDAKYRTLPVRDSRGITGCSMGGDGSLHLALKYPDVFSVAVPMSGTYDYEHDRFWDEGKKGFKSTPEDFDDFSRLPFETQWYIAGAAAAAPNPDKPPLYLDLPFKLVDGKGEIVPEVWEKINAVDAVHDVRYYLEQPIRLRGLMIYHGKNDNYSSVEVVRDFDKMLTELGVEHKYLEVDRGHCDLNYTPVLQFMSDHLVF